MNYRGILLLGWVLTSACTYRAPDPDISGVNPRFVHQLPEGARCVLLDEIEVLEGNNCMAAGLNQAGQASILRYNVLQKARKQGANTVIPGEMLSHQWAGCADPGLSMRAKLYRCDYAN